MDRPPEPFPAAGRLIPPLTAIVVALLIRQHCQGDFENPQWYGAEKPLEQRLPEQFMFVYKKWKTEGEPSDPAEAAGSVNAPADES